MPDNGKDLYFYCISFNNNTIKAGKTTDPKRRLQSHSSQAKKYGKNLHKDIILAGPYPKDEEKRLLNNLSKKFIKLDKEWFSMGDLQIDDAVSCFPDDELDN